MSHHHVSFKDLPAGGEKFEPAKASKLIGTLLVLGLAGLAGSAYYFINESTRAAFAYSWLFAVFFSFTFIVGGVFWIMLHNASNSSWGVAVRRLFEQLANMAPWVGVLALPFLLPQVQDALWEWFPYHRAAEAAHAASLEEGLHHINAPHALVEKAGYMNIKFWYFRFFFYFGVLTYIARKLRGFFLAQDKDGDIKHTLNARGFACLLFLPFALTATFASVDWLMGLDYLWFSTMWGVYIFAGCAWSSMALTILVLTYLRSIGYMLKVTTMEHYHLMGKLLFAFTVFWAYIAFSQYFLIWYANIPEETRFYLIRNTGEWRWVSIFIVAGHFIVPFVALLSQTRKKNPTMICLVCVWVLFMHLVDMYWNVIPERGPSLAKTVLIDGAWKGDIVALVGVFCTLGYIFMRSLGKHSLYAHRDPRLVESVNVIN